MGGPLDHEFTLLAFLQRSRIAGSQRLNDYQLFVPTEKKNMSTKILRGAECEDKSGPLILFSQRCSSSLGRNMCAVMPRTLHSAYAC
jgi:hypothetical protein